MGNTKKKFGNIQRNIDERSHLFKTPQDIRDEAKITDDKTKLAIACYVLMNDTPLKEICNNVGVKFETIKKRLHRYSMDEVKLIAYQYGLLKNQNSELTESTEEWLRKKTIDFLFTKLWQKKLNELKKLEDSALENV